MRSKGFIISLIITIILIVVLNNRWGQVPPAGKFFSPQLGFWQNATPVNNNYSCKLKVKGVERPVSVWFDAHLVPHIFAQDDRDAYYVQGYITARFRLWQMDLQVRAAGGDLSEVIGEKTLQYDRLQRRKGMVTDAENSLAVMEADSATKAMMDAYTAGVNAYIATLNYRKLPLEYKLLDYKPVKWTNLKTALLLKYMSDMLTGGTSDMENTNALKLLGLQQFNQMFPDYPDSLYPIIPKGTPFYKPSVSPSSIPSDSLIAVNKEAVRFQSDKRDIDNGSNNWVVNGKKTRSGAPILCNDPHLGLNLPSLWFEVQIHTPDMDVYGASLPGAPGVIIGFNNYIAWGLTNAQRDVSDYYAIRFKDASMKQYWYDSSWKNAAVKIEKINIRGHKTFYDTVAYTVFGPVMYDPSFPDTLSDHQYLALHWAAADSSDELKTMYLMNHARNFDDYKNALKYFECPGQNFAYADISGNIAIWQQGKFPVRRSMDFGKFILPGDDSLYLWHSSIPFLENPHILDPEQNFVYSANQNPTDTTYPYFYHGEFIQFRARRIYHFLNDRNNLTIEDMMKLQNDYYDGFAAEALPIMLRHLDTAGLSRASHQYLDSLRHWDLEVLPGTIKPLLFYSWWDSLYENIWSDVLNDSLHLPMPRPTDNTTIEWLIRDTTMPLVNTGYASRGGNLRSRVYDAFIKAMNAVQKLDSTGKLNWGIYRGTDIMHLARIPALSRMHLFTGGDRYTVSAIKKDHGPSWRMIVQMSNPIVAYGIYPGGQSGNPGSRYYDDFVDDWVRGKYYKLNFFSPDDSTSAEVKYKIIFVNKKE
ncbi:MAG: penicillin acylase family protein [Chitinophagaceae bacterium]|nr:MAG: penicillin acylase family protein [Chitinophagaceae bacterium]